VKPPKGEEKTLRRGKEVIGDGQGEKRDLEKNENGRL